MSTLSVLVVTRSRGTLGRAVESARVGLLLGDEVVVIGAGPQPPARDAALKLGARYEEVDPAGGMSEWRDSARALARGDLVLWLDETDMLLGGATALLRAVAAERGAPVVYRGQHRNGITERAVLARREQMGSWLSLAGYVQDTLARAGGAAHELQQVAYFIKPYPDKW